MNVCQRPASSAASARELLLLDRTCQCVPLSRSAIDERLLADSGLPNMAALLQARPHLFAATAVFLGARDLAAMRSQIDAIEAVTRLSGYQDAIQARGLDDLSLTPATAGIFMGYDFHLTETGPRLIEVNTNAGGAFIMQALLAPAGQAALPCGPDSIDDPGAIEARIVAMLRAEWVSAGHVGQPKVIAIVDEHPEEQYLYPDMLLAQQLMLRHGMHAEVVAPAELTIRAGRLWHDSAPIDMVYNRLTDFSLTQPGHHVLRKAHTQRLAVVTPGPEHHALFADKRNLALWQDRERLTAWGAGATHQHALTQLLETEPVNPAEADQWWPARKQYFFKPSGGYGGKAAYRGAKVTRRVWKTIASGGYVAQTYAPPPLRDIATAGPSALMKFDIRLYTYQGVPLLAAARIYQGQTTNFRSAGGGFAPVIYVD